MKVESETQFWRNTLRSWPREYLEDIDISERDAGYLKDIGLPTGVDWHLTMVDPSRDQADIRDHHLLIVAHDSNVPICLDLRTGLIVAAEDLRKDVIRLVNSNITAFGRFLVIYQQYRNAVLDLPEEDALALIEDVEKTMIEIDAASMRSKEDYWPVIIEQMRDGML